MPVRFSRRDLLVVGGTSLGAVALTGCAGGIDEPELTGVEPGNVLVALSEVPVGGAYELSIDGRRVLISQPTAGTVIAFDATCTHQGCTVRATDAGMVCPCHGSAFDPATGAAVHGPASRPLAPVGVAIRGSDVVLT